MVLHFLTHSHISFFGVTPLLGHCVAAKFARPCYGLLALWKTSGGAVFMGFDAGFSSLFMVLIVYFSGFKWF